MNRYSRIVTWIALVSLLFGNVAGWVHVGCETACHDPQCGADARETGCHSHDHGHDSEAQYIVHDAAGGCAAGIDSDAKTTCCAVETPSGGVPAERGRNSDHDSEHCGLCQHFFASRYAIVFVAPALTICGEVFCETPALPEDIFPESTLHNTVSVRGPPRV